MGGSVSMRALLATDIVSAASFWSTMNLDSLVDDIRGLDLRVNVHHDEGDGATPVANSDSLAAALTEAGLLAEYGRYPEADHFFAEERRQFAADKDADLFRSMMR
jgi:dienelactone hydrolase